MDESTLNGYVTLIEVIVSAGLQTFEQLRALLGSSVGPENLDLILAETKTRLARRGITTA